MRNLIENPFASFWMGGFESSDQLNVHGERTDFLHLTSHHEMLEADYDKITELNMQVVREGVRWSQVEYRPYQYDFSTLEQMLQVAKAKGIQQVWDLCHFGYPDDLTPLHPHFTRRFVAYCRAFAQFYGKFDIKYPLIVTPVNEVGFISWLGGEVAGTAPYCHNHGWEVKYVLMKAYIAGIKEIRSIEPHVRILTTEPLVSITAAIGATPEQRLEAERQHELQFQVLDMLSGRICPELGGEESFLDILGFNYYYDNQWELDPHQVLGWRDAFLSDNYQSPSSLLYGVFKRYDRPIVLSETSHPGVDRAIWIAYITREINDLFKYGIPFWGICIYPVIDRPDWDNLGDWHHSGIWDHNPDGESGSRVPHQPTLKALLDNQQSIFDTIQGNSFQREYRVKPIHKAHE